MKKFLALLFAGLLFSTQAFCGGTSVQFTDPYNVVATTTVATADAAIKATPGYLHGVLVSFKGAAIGDTVDINDNSAAGGTVKVRFTTPSASSTFYYQPITPIPYSTTGIYCDVTLSSGTVNVVAQYS